MAKAKVKLNFIDFDVPLKIQFCTDRNNDMQTSTNPLWATPDVAYATITSNISDVADAWQAFEGGGQGTKDALDDAVLILDNNMRLQCAFVDRKADGNVTLIHNIGFETTSTERTPAQPPVEVTGIKLSHGNTGSIGIEFDTQDNHRSFTAIITTEPTIEITTIGNQVIIGGNTRPVIFHTGTKLKKTITNLTSATRVYVIVYCTNTAGTGPMSAMMNIVVP